jgi:hypothetical protein
MFLKFLQININTAEHSLWKEQVEARIALRDINLKFWLEYNLFSLVWWLMIIISIAVWLIWWKLVNKSRLLEIITYGLMVSFLSVILDLIGAELVLWGYPNMIIPLMPPLLIVDIGVLPVTYMIIYQNFPDWKKYIIAISITAFLISFIGEPIAIWLDMYEMNNWQHIYSFPIFITIGLILKWIMNKIILKQAKN